MPEPDDKVLFGAEFDSSKVTEGVDEILSSLEKAEEAQGLLKQAIKETTDALKANRKEFEATKKAMTGTLDQKLIDEYKKKLDGLNGSYDDLAQQQADLGVAYKKTNGVIKEFNKAQTESTKGSNEVSKAIKKTTSLHHFAADEIKKVGKNVKEMALGFVTGFAGGLVSTVIPTLIDLIGNMEEFGFVLDATAKRRQTLNEVFESAAQGAGGEIAKLTVFRDKLNDTNIPAAERVRLAKEYNKTAEETNKIDVNQINNLDLINQQLEKQNKLIIARAISTAALSKLTEAATELVEEQLKLDQELRDKNLKESDVVAKLALRSRQENEGQRKALKANQQSLDGVNVQLTKNISLEQERQRNSSINLVNITKEERAIEKLLNSRNKAQEELNKLAELLNPLISVDGLTTRTTKAVTTIENVYAQKLAELKARLAAITVGTFQSEGLIRRRFEEQLNKDYVDIAKLLKEKKLTIPQADILKALLKQINDVELANGLKEFKDKQTAALKAINDEIFTAQVEAQTKRVAGIRDDFEREQAQLDLNLEQAKAALDKRQAELLKKVDTDTEAGLISPEVAKRKKLMIRLIFGDLLDQAEQAKHNAELDLAMKTFQKTLEEAKKGFENAILEGNEDTTKLIREQVGLFLEGKITYERYQKNLTQILKDESRERRKIALEEAEAQLALVQKQLATTTDPKQLKQLQEQEAVLRGTVSQLKREVATGAADDQNSDEKKKIDQLLAYVNAVQGLATAVLNFWQQVNAAEAAALDRSIALQNRRVENAREIADKGNAEFLEMEQKRLDELERKREANARKQIAINNALVASQAIVAAISAIAQAVSTGSPIAAIAALAAVIGAIGAAFSFVNSLQPQSSDFFEGTPFVNGPEGRDKVPANLTRGERVVTKKDNEAYWPALEAMRRGVVTPEEMNSFVQQYPVSTVPGIDFDRLGLATEGKIGVDNAELLNKVDRLNGTMEQVVVGLSEIGINVNMDEHGLEVAISRARKSRRLKSRS